MQCVDAETLAAWADGGLSKDVAASVELHLADCERCTAMVATFVRTTPPAPVPQSLWTRWHLRWLVPIATAATAVAIWVATPREQTGPTTTLDTEQTAQLEAPRETQSQAGNAAARPEKEAEPPASEPRPDARATREAPAAPRELRRDTIDSLADSRTAAPPSAAPAPAAPAADAPAGVAPEAQARASAPAVAPRSAARESDQKVAAAPAVPIADAQSFATARQETALIAQLQVLSPNPMTRWRVVGPGRVERSTNGGSTWQLASFPEAATLTGGSSPSPSVCWLVGRTGAIYVTTDGLTFVRVPFQERTDFVSIQATDARRATVVTIDGRTFRTEDQGATWVRVSP